MKTEGGAPRMPEETMREIGDELHSTLIAIRELIEREYPSRKEVERRFVSKHKSQQRLGVLLLVILISGALSFIGTVSTVSTCFLGDSDHPSACQAMPGYKESEDRQK